jgi:hypothetical protein
MACFSDTNYANWSYQILITLNNVSESTPISLGCFSVMNPVEQMYQFYLAFRNIADRGELLSQNCFMSLTDAKQWEALNAAIELAFTPPET